MQKAQLYLPSLRSGTGLIGAAVAKILRLDGVVEAPLSPIRSPGQELAMNLDVERMAASFAITAPVKKKPRH